MLEMSLNNHNTAKISTFQLCQKNVGSSASLRIRARFSSSGIQRNQHSGNFLSHRINSFIISLRNFHPKSLKPNPEVHFVGYPMISLAVINLIVDRCYFEIAQTTLYWFPNCKDHKDWIE